MALFGSDKDTSSSQAPAPAAAAPEKPAPAPKKSPRAPATDGARIGQSVRIEGEVRGDEDLILDGQVKGTIELGTHQLTIGESGRAEADVSGRRVRVLGEVKGNVDAQEAIELGPTARVHGNLRAPQLRLEEGAQVNGRIDMGGGSGPAPAKAKPASNGADPDETPSTADDDAPADEAAAPA